MTGHGDLAPVQPIGVGKALHLVQRMTVAFEQCLDRQNGYCSHSSGSRDWESSARVSRGAAMSVQEAAKSTLGKSLIKWLILGIFILLVRVLRWGGILGLVGIGTFAGAIWLAFHLADADTGELTGAEGMVVLVLLLAGVATYVVGVKQRRGSQQIQVMPTSVHPEG
jgi:hypothetical protein